MSRHIKYIVLNSELPDHVKEWFKLQTDKNEALKYLVYKDIYRNGVRDLFYTEDECYGTEKKGTLYGSSLPMHENGDFGQEQDRKNYTKDVTPPAKQYNRKEVKEANEIADNVE